MRAIRGGRACAPVGSCTGRVMYRFPFKAIARGAPGHLNLLISLSTRPVACTDRAPHARPSMSADASPAEP